MFFAASRLQKSFETLSHVIKFLRENETLFESLELIINFRKQRYLSVRYRDLRWKHVAMKVSCAMTAAATVQSITSKKLLHAITLNVKSHLSNTFAIAEKKNEYFYSSI